MSPNDPDAPIAQAEPLDQTLVYFDANMLVHSVMGSSDPATNVSLRRMFALFKKFKLSGTLRPVTSTWALMEAQGVIYKELVVANPAIIWHGDVRERHKLRNDVPPHDQELKDANKLTGDIIKNLVEHSDYPPTVEPDMDATFWAIANFLSSECALQPPDSIHLAIAIVEGCSILYTQDKDFILKFEHCREELLKNFANFGVISILKIRSVLTFRSYLPPEFIEFIPSANDELEEMGFK